MALFSESSRQMLGMLDAIDASFPATNADGTANQPARDNAINNLAAQLFMSGIVAVPAGQTIQQFAALVTGMVNCIATYKNATKRPSLPV